MEAFPAVGNQVQNKSETTSVTLSMRRSRAKKIVQKMQAPPATGKQVQNKLENSVIPRYLEQRRKYRRWKLLQLLGIKYRTSQRLTLSMRRSRAKKIVQEMEAAPATGKQVQNK